MIGGIYGVGGLDTSDATATTKDILKNKTAYVDDKKLTGTMEEHEAKTFNPSTIKQTSGEGHYKEVIINPVTSAIDSNINQENIKKDVTVLGITGNFTSDGTIDKSTVLDGKIGYSQGNKIVGEMSNNGELTYNPSTADQTIPAGYTSGGTVKKVTSNIDSNIKAENIKTGNTILGVTGNYTGDGTLNSNANLLTGNTAYAKGIKYTGSMANKGSKTFTPTTEKQTSDSGFYTDITVNAIQTQSKTVTPTTSKQTVTPDSGKYLSSVDVNAIETQTKTASPSTSQQTIKSDNGKYLSSVTVNAVTKSIDNNITAGNIKDGVSILGQTCSFTGDGTLDSGAKMIKGYIAYSKGVKYTGTIENRGAKTFTPTTAKQTGDEGYYTGITVNAIPTQTKTVNPSTSQQTVTPDEGNFLTELTVNKVTASIDSNIVAGNIKKGISILGITGNYTEDGTATAAQIQSGKIAYVNGSKVTGTLAPAAGNIKTGVTIAGVAGTYTSDATAEAGNILKDKTAYVNGSKITGTMANNGSKTYTPSTSKQTGGAGYYSGVTVNAISTQTKTATPTTAQQTISPDSGKYLTGVTVSAVDSTIDSNIIAGNIKSGTTILGVEGSFTSDATATATQIQSGKTAYVNGEKLTGTLSYLTPQKSCILRRVYESHINYSANETRTFTPGDVILVRRTTTIIADYDTSEIIKKGESFSLSSYLAFSIGYVNSSDSEGISVFWIISTEKNSTYNISFNANLLHKG